RVMKAGPRASPGGFKTITRGAKGMKNALRKEPLPPGECLHSRDRCLTGRVLVGPKGDRRLALQLAARGQVFLCSGPAVAIHSSQCSSLFGFVTGSWVCLQQCHGFASASTRRSAVVPTGPP